MLLVNRWGIMGIMGHRSDNAEASLGCSLWIPGTRITFFCHCWGIASVKFGGSLSVAE